MSTSRLYDKVYGCLVGGLVGDALGGPAEGLHYRAIQERYGEIVEMLEYRGRPAGSATDDSMLKHMLCKAIVRKRGRVTPDDWAEVWREDMDPRHFMTPVANTYYKIAYAGVPPREAGRGNMTSNSSAMCISPIGILDAGDPARAAADAYDVTQLIHSGFPQDGASAAAAAVAEAFRPEATAESIAGAAIRHIPAGEMRHALETILALAREAGDYHAFRERYYEGHLLPWPRRPDDPPERSTAVDPRESVSVALAILALARGDTHRTIVGCANFGRDADTIATIAGAVVGALNGAGSIPERWLRPVLAVVPVDQAALAGQLLDVLLEQVAQVEARVAGLRALAAANS